jgi:acyl dehydratase
VTDDRPQAPVSGRLFDARTGRFGRWWDELQVGDVYRHWPGKTITAADDHLFCLLTMSAHPLHIDEHYARTEVEGGRNLVLGTYIYALVAGMSVPDISGRAIANLEIERLRHLAPTFHGDTIYAETTVIATRESRSKPDRGIVTVETQGMKETGEVVVDFIRSVLIPRRPKE